MLMNVKFFAMWNNVCTFAFELEYNVMKQKAQYQANKAAKVGSEIVCPICGTTFIKRQWQQAFCCSECKNKYWNSKGDRHKAGYYEEYDAARPERQKRRELYGSNRIVSIGGELTPRMREDAFTKLLRDKEYMEIYEDLPDDNLPW